MEVKWIKLATNMFEDEKIKQIRGLPQADTILVIWVELLCLAGKLNNDGIFIDTKQRPYTPQKFAVSFGHDADTIKMALDELQDNDLIDIVDGIVTIPNWGKNQSIDKLRKQREYQREYKRAYRQRQKALIEGAEAPILPEPESEPEAETESKTTSKSIQHDPDYLKIIDYLNEKCGTNFRPQTKKTQQFVQARMNDGYTVEDFMTVIDNKSREWKNDPKMCIYLRPETLFGTKFESYLVSHNGVKPVQIQEPQSKYQ